MCLLHKSYRFPLQNSVNSYINHNNLNYKRIYVHNHDLATNIYITYTSIHNFQHDTKTDQAQLLQP
jgi:hypothetical protein